MSDWHDISTAPKDRKIMGRNADGAEKLIWSVKLHPKADLDIWVSAVSQEGPNWERREMFYPVEWQDAP